MEIYISLSRAMQINANALQSVLGFRVLDHKLLREENGLAFYAFVTFAGDDSGDYELKVAKLIRKGITDHSFKLKDINVIGTGYQSVYDAANAMEKLDRDGKYLSHSSPPPRQSAVFSLADFHIQADPNIQIKLDLWRETQNVCPLRYVVYNTITDSIEVGYKDASAYNSTTIYQMLRASIYQALGDYSAGKDFETPSTYLM